jgi:hypothetical protein
MLFTLKYNESKVQKKNNSTRIEQLNKSYKWQILALITILKDVDVRIPPWPHPPHPYRISRIVN